MSRRSYAGGAAPTSLASPITTSSSTATLNSSVGYPDGSTGPFALVLDKGTSAEEKVLVSARSGVTITFAVRGYDGTTAQNHSAAAGVEHCITSVDVDEANAHINATTGVHGLNVGDQVVGRSTPATLLNKVLSGGVHAVDALTIGGSAAVTTDGGQTLTGKTLVAPVVTGVMSAQVIGANSMSVGGAPVVTTNAGQTLTNKTLVGCSLDTPTIVNGSFGGVAALSGGSLIDGLPIASRTGTETLTNKTLTTPTINNATLTGAVTLGGVPVAVKRFSPVQAVILSETLPTSGTIPQTLLSVVLDHAAGAEAEVVFTFEAIKAFGNAGANAYSLALRANGTRFASAFGRIDADFPGALLGSGISYPPVVVRGIVTVPDNSTTFDVVLTSGAATYGWTLSAGSTTPAILSVSPFTLS